MSKSATPIAILVTVTAVVSAVAPACAAAPTKVWVSNAGVDSASCGAVTAPCKTFGQAQTNVAAGGEIGVLTPGDYAPVFIAKSVSITNDSTGEAGIQVGSSGTGVQVNAGPGDIVGLRGLVIDGLGTGGFGIEFLHGSALHVQNCVIRNFEGFANSVGLLFAPSGHSRLFLSDSLIYNNGGVAVSGGIQIAPQGAGSSADAVIDRVHLENNVRGLWVQGGLNGSHVVLRDSVVSGNAADGIFAETASGGGPAFIVVERITAVNNAASGIHADGPGATVLLSDSTISRNGAGVTTANSGQLISYGNNRNNNNLGPEGTATGFFGPF